MLFEFIALGTKQLTAITRDYPELIDLGKPFRLADELLGESG
jgi:hypothetical protein